MKFNSLQFAESLEEQGFSQTQARGIAYGAFNCFDIEKLVTKDEIKHLATKEDLARSVHTLFMHLLGVIIAAQTVMIGLMYFLHR
jgi:hypothetical protein